MLLGVLRMPLPNPLDPLTLAQFVGRARQAASRIEADAAEIVELRAEIERLNAQDTESLLAVNAAQAEELEELRRAVAAERERWNREPVAAQCRFPGVAWTQCDVEHARMVLAKPSEWPRYEVRLLCEWVGPNAEAQPKTTARRD
jgi:hypothetical protein